MASNWIAKATSKNRGKFSRKAKRAGMSTAAYARKERNAPGALGKEARLAQTLEKVSRGKKKQTKRATSRRKKRIGSRKARR